MNQGLRRRYRYLRHLSTDRLLSFVEMDLQPPIASQETVDEMPDSLLPYSRKREQQLQKKLPLALTNEEAENRISTVSLDCRLLAYGDLTEAPTDEDFVPLCENPGVESDISRFHSSQCLNSELLPL
ncbi:unnamed protein product [Dibothriocephalus latus]|uniref:Uncharacterized protein n=1 Tax=Dibothriocephalus latus TaxID=60516 RepID=A0A3P7NC91_DIBLA|nr:unnamed protein product [Dibothriocephalus latus]